MERLKLDSIMRKGSRARILLVARHPVGGILTFFRYIYGQELFNEYDFTVITPDPEQAETLSKIFNNGDFRFIACDSSIDMARKVWKYLRGNDVALINSHGFSALKIRAVCARGRSIKSFPQVERAARQAAPGREQRCRSCFTAAPTRTMTSIT